MIRRPPRSTLFPYTTLFRSGHAHHRALGHVAMGGEHLFHRPRGEPVARDVDDVVGAAHHPEIAVLILVAGVGRQVVARVPAHVRDRKSTRLNSSHSQISYAV